MGIGKAASQTAGNTGDLISGRLCRSRCCQEYKQFRFFKIIFFPSVQFVVDNNKTPAINNILTSWLHGYINSPGLMRSGYGSFAEFFTQLHDAQRRGGSILFQFDCKPAFKARIYAVHHSACCSHRPKWESDASQFSSDYDHFQPLTRRSRTSHCGRLDIMYR